MSILHGTPCCPGPGPKELAEVGQRQAEAEEQKGPRAAAESMFVAHVRCVQQNARLRELLEDGLLASDVASACAAPDVPPRTGETMCEIRGAGIDAYRAALLKRMEGEDAN